VAEKKIIYQDNTLKFQGIFDLRGLFRSIMKWCKDRNYDMIERKNYEEVYEDGKKVIFELLPYKKVTDYHKIEIRIYAVFENLKEIEVEMKGVKQRLLKGDANFNFDVTLITDYENRWEGRAAYFFFRTLIDKFIYKPHTDTYEKQAFKEAKEIQEEIKAYLNMFRYSV
jgi:hypothetical protein